MVVASSRMMEGSENEAVRNDVSLRSCRILPDAFQPSAIFTTDHVMDISGDDIADVVLKQFDTWPMKGKPLVRGGGVKEWVPLSGIVAQGRNSLTCLAVATGMKCLPQVKVGQAQGIVLHDWHAEILAIRSFNRFLLEECHALALSAKKSSEYIRLRSDEERTAAHFQPFALNDGINLYMYCSEAPCGDASMELTMAAQDDSTPWEISPITTTPEQALPPSYPLDPSLTTSAPETAHPPSILLHGRGYFSALGTVRRKPSRPDAPPTLSKSCSDKISLNQCTSLLSSTTSLLISPSNVYLSSIVLPESQYSETACKRAFSADGRMKDVKGMTWEGGYKFKPFEIKRTGREFKHSRRQHVVSGEKLVPSNISASWIASKCPAAAKGKVELESLIGGTLQGRKQFDVRGASRVCKKRMWKLAMEVAGSVAGLTAVERCMSHAATYGTVKRSQYLECRRRVKDDVREKALKGWVRNSGGEEFGYEDGAT